MFLLKITTMFALINMMALGAVADQAHNDVKLAILISEESRLDGVNISSDDKAIKSEQYIDGEESFSTIVSVNVKGQVKTYIINKDGGGQILSIQLSK